MSTPLFIREPQIGAAIALGSAARSADIVNNSFNPFASLFFSVAEATLVEDLLWCVSAGVNVAGTLLVVICDSAYGGFNPVVLVREIAVSASGAQRSGGRVSLNLTLPVGWSMGFVHDVTATGAGDYVHLHVSAIGGIVR